MRAALLLLALLALLLAPPATARGLVPTEKVVSMVRAVLQKLVRGDKTNYIPGFARLAFHDCCSTTCDGCIDVNSAENKGLGNRVTAINAAFDGNATIKAGMTRADFWALGMVVAVEEGNDGKGIPVGRG